MYREDRKMDRHTGVGKDLEFPDLLLWGSWRDALLPLSLAKQEGQLVASRLL